MYKRSASFPNDDNCKALGAIGRARSDLPSDRAAEYNIGDGDVRRVQESMAKLSEMFFAVGASKILCPDLRTPQTDTMGVLNIPLYMANRTMR